MDEFVDEDGVPDVAGAREHVLGYLVSFARTLRRSGVAVSSDASVTAARALVEVGFDDRERVRAALRSTLIASEADLAVFDRLFPSFWRQFRGTDDEFVAPEQGPSSPVSDSQVVDLEPATEHGDVDDSREDDAGEPLALSRALDRSPLGHEATSDDLADDPAHSRSVYSPVGRSSAIDAPRPGAGDDELTVAVDRLADALAALPGRRWARAGDESIDTRSALRRSVATGGALLSIPRRKRRRSAVRATVLVDVSRSVLDTIDRAFLLGFLRQIRRDWRTVRLFFFDTSVREVSDAFDAPSTTAAGEALERAETEWGGGTRIGNAIDTVRREHPDAVDRKSVVFVISDGLEVGELDVLETGMSWLSRRAGAVLWLNPLAASREYEPTCRGMAVALPFVDGLFAFTGSADVEEIARQLERRGLAGPLGYEFDPRMRSSVDGEPESPRS